MAVYWFTPFHHLINHYYVQGNKELERAADFAAPKFRRQGKSF